MSNNDIILKKIIWSIGDKKKLFVNVKKEISEKNEDVIKSCLTDNPDLFVLKKYFETSKIEDIELSLSYKGVKLYHLLQRYNFKIK